MGEYITDIVFLALVISSVISFFAGVWLIKYEAPERFDD
jgi:ABC-type phosphate transport system permease subunit